MASNIQLLHPLNPVQPNTCIQLADVTRTPWGSQNQQVIMAAIINNIVQTATMNTLRTALFNCYAMNGWNNQPFINHAVMVIKLVTKRVIESGAANNPQQAAQLTGAIVAEANKAALGEAMEGLRQNGMIGYLTQEEVNGASMLLNGYRQLQAEANQPIQQPVMYNQPMQAGAAWAGTVNGVVQQPGVQTTSNVWQQAVNNAPTQSDSGYTSSTWKQPAKETVEQEVVIDPEEDWVECTVKEWRPSKEQPYIFAYNPNTHISKFFKNGNGKVRQEIIEMDYAVHARTTPLTHALFEKRRDEMNQKLGREVTDEEVAEVIFKKETPRMRLPAAYDLNFEANLYSESEATMAASYFIIRLLTEDLNCPLSKFNIGRHLSVYLERREDVSLVDKCSAFITDLIATKTYEESAACMRKHASEDISRFWNIVNDALTDEFNTVISVLFSIPNLKITDFAGDVIDMLNLIRERYGDYIYRSLTSEENYFVNKFLVLDTPERMQEIMDEINIYEDDRKYDMFLTRVLSKHYIVNMSSDELEMPMNRGEFLSLEYKTSKYLRNLCEDIIDECSDVYGMYLHTIDGARYRIFRGTLDPNQCLLYRLW